MLQCYDDWVTVCPKRGLELTSPPRVSATSATCKPCFISWLQASANNLENTSHWKTSDSSCTLVETFDILRVYFPGECQANLFYKTNTNINILSVSKSRIKYLCSPLNAELYVKCLEIGFSPEFAVFFAVNFFFFSQPQPKFSRMKLMSTNVMTSTAFLRVLK